MASNGEQRFDLYSDEGPTPTPGADRKPAEAPPVKVDCVVSRQALLSVAEVIAERDRMVEFIKNVRDNILYPLAHEEGTELGKTAEGLGQLTTTFYLRPTPELVADEVGHLERRIKSLKLSVERLG